LNRGCAYQSKHGYEKAIADYTEAIRLDPRCAGAYFNRGLALRKKGESAKAEEDFAQAKKLGWTSWDGDAAKTPGTNGKKDEIR
jgi:tetratricopeptide (TPR) repeat protein